MITEKGISGNPPTLESLNFDTLREKGIAYIQELSGDVWTDYNLHDPGITLLEILCYALTDAGYRTEQIAEAFLSKEPISGSYVEKYLFSPEELLPASPITQQDIEHFIESNHEAVTVAWATPFPLLRESETIRGGYGISVLLSEELPLSNLNSDEVEVKLEDKKVRIQFILFTEDNQRLPWNTIDKIKGCRIAFGHDQPFYRFEQFNAQLLLELDVKFKTAKTFENIPVKARITVTGIDKPLPSNSSITKYKDLILDMVATLDFIHALDQQLKKERYKEGILKQIQRSLLPIRNLCEDFIRFHVVNIQEIKMNVQLLLEEDAPADKEIMQRVYEQMDTFMLSLVKKRKSIEERGGQNILYASNIIEALGTIQGIKAVQIENLNLFVDGIPTISLREEGSFDCVHLQNFARYAPKVSREKSSITLIRHGLHQTFRLSQVTAPFTPKSLTNFFIESPKEEVISKGVLNDTFLESLRTYESIQQEFPQNYRLTSGKILEKAPKHIKEQQKRFKSYLLFYDRILLAYMERLFQLNNQFSLKPTEELYTTPVDELIVEQLPDIKALDLIQDVNNTSAGMPMNELQQQLVHKNQVLDHLLARFGLVYQNLESKTGMVSEHHVKAKIRMLRDVPIITRERSLGLPLLKDEENSSKGAHLSGLQKRLYRLLGVGEEAFKNKKLSTTTGKKGQGFYLIEHFLLTQRPEDNVFAKKLNHASSLLVDFLNELNSEADTDFNHSFEVSILIPAWYREWSNNRKGYEKIIKTETPAHIVPQIHWVPRNSLEGFEILYEDWLKALYQTYN